MPGPIRGVGLSCDRTAAVPDAYGLVRMWRATIVVTYVLEAIIVIVAAVHTVIVASVVTLLVGVLVIGLLASTRRRDRPALVVGL